MKTITKRFPKLRHSLVILQKSHKKGVWEKAMNKIVQKVHIDAGRTQKPSYCLIDSQNAKTTNCNEKRGIDGEKNQRPQKTHYN